jgi:2,3-bisphosphoglycerate-independent phosphoglycerate mutase
MITDGRDTGPQTALNYLPKLEGKLHEAGGAIASIMGRYYAMDRDNRWDRTELAWRALIHGKGERCASAESAICSAYAAGDHDEFIRPILLPKFERIQDQQPCISFNFRKDRPRQLVSALSKPAFTGFDRGDAALADVYCMLRYDKGEKLAYLFDSEQPDTTLGEVVSNMGLAQFHCAETEKYPHVTYFFNGGRAEPYSGETQLLIPSPKVSTYDHQPQMSAHEVADAVIGAIGKGRYAFMVVNFANGDMVGHTAKYQAVIEAVETLDREVGRVLAAAETAGYSVVLTADHGNCEEMVDKPAGAPHTQHTNNPVPCLVMDEEFWKLSCEGDLTNIAPTILQLMGIAKPLQMGSNSLLLESIPFAQKPLHIAPELKGVA